MVVVVVVVKIIVEEEVVIFDCLPHSLLIATVHTYGSDKTSTEYLSLFELSQTKDKNISMSTYLQVKFDN